MTVTIKRRLLIWLVIMVSVSPMLMAGLGVWYTSYAIRQNNHRLCSVLEISDRPVPPSIKDPAQRARTLEGVRRIHKLRIEYGCIKK